MSLPGKILYQLWHRPLGAVRTSLAAGGPLAQRRTEAGRREMEAAARTLPLLPVRPGAPLTFHLLTGRRFWYQTAFCLWTLAHTTQRNLTPVIIDDGSLAPDQIDSLRRLFPAMQVWTDAENNARLDEHLPRRSFPSLRARGDEFPLLRKLTHPHVGKTGWKLLIDSDLLFFHRPTLLVDWLDHPSVPLRATDIMYTYGYPLPLLNELAGQPVPELVNTGLLGLRSEEIDWDKQEYWCRTLIERQGTHYYQEQALVALMLAGRPNIAAPLSDYVTMPVPPETRECRAVMHHYVANSKAAYFQHCWRTALTLANRPGGS